MYSSLALCVSLCLPRAPPPDWLQVTWEADDHLMDGPSLPHDSLPQPILSAAFISGRISTPPYIHVHLGVPCRPGTGTPGHGTVPPCPGTARRDLVPCRASTPCRLSCPGTARLSLDGPCRAWGTVSPAVPCRARAQDTKSSINSK